MTTFFNKYEKKFIKYIFLNPQLSFFVYFLFVSSYALSDRSLIILYLILFPWIAIIILILNLPFFMLIFRGVKMDELKKINHVLEHGTIYYLKQKYGRKHKVGGRALSSGFRVYGVNSTEDIKESFDNLLKNLEDGHNGVVLSKFCGSNVPILQGVSLVILTASFIIMITVDLVVGVRLMILLFNLLCYMLFRYPVGKYFQKKLTMSFDFRNAQIISILKTKRDDFFEEDPVYLVETRVIH